MKLHKYLFLLVSWNPQLTAEGFRLYYREVGIEKECDESRKEDFIHQVNVGEKNQFDLKALSIGSLYEIRATAYSGKFETELSKERICIRIKDNKTEKPIWEKPKESQPQPAIQPIVNITHNIEEEIKAPEKPTNIANIEAVELKEEEVIEETETYEEDIDSDEPSAFLFEPRRDSDTGMGSHGTTAASNGLQHVLQREDSPKLQPDKQSEYHNIRYSSSQDGRRIHLFKEADIGYVGDGQGVLRSSNGIFDGKRHDGRVGVLKRGVRIGEGITTKPSYWTQGRIIVWLSVLAAIVLGGLLLFRKEDA